MAGFRTNTRAQEKRQEEAAALEVLLAEGRKGLTREEAVAALAEIRQIATTLHRIYTRQCNGHQTPAGDWDEAAAKRDEEREEREEARLRKLFKELGLGLYLQGDPRGNPVGIHTPKTGRYNTMGGKECGWRL